MPNMGRREDRVLPFDLHQSSRADEAKLWVWLIGRQTKDRNGIVFELAANFVQYVLRNILDWNIHGQMISFNR